MAKKTPEQKALDALYKAVSMIASKSEWPMAPAQYEATQRAWRQMVLAARKAKAEADSLLGKSEE